MVELNPKTGLSKSCNPKSRGAFHVPKFETRPDIMLLNIHLPKKKHCENQYFRCYVQNVSWLRYYCHPWTSGLFGFGLPVLCLLGGTAALFRAWYASMGAQPTRWGERKGHRVFPKQYGLWMGFNHTIVGITFRFFTPLRKTESLLSWLTNFGVWMNYKPRPNWDAYGKYGLTPSKSIPTSMDAGFFLLLPLLNMIILANFWPTTKRSINHTRIIQKVISINKSSKISRRSLIS